MAERILFIDRDGTLVEEPNDFQVDALAKVRLVAGVVPALLELAAHGFRFVMVSNQDGRGTQSFPEEQFRVTHEYILALFESQGIAFDEIFICPHLPEDRCECRKPRTGMSSLAREMTPTKKRSFSLSLTKHTLETSADSLLMVTTQTVLCFTFLMQGACLLSFCFQ